MAVDIDALVASRHSLANVDMSGRYLVDYDFHNLSLSGADLRGANLRGADLRGADLSNANISRADLCGANLNGAHLSGANFTGAKLSGCSMKGVVAKRRAVFLAASMHDVNLVEAQLDNSDLRNAHLGNANLRGVILRESNLAYADMAGANLSMVNFHRANLTCANMVQANISGTIFIDAEMSGAIIPFSSGVDARGYTMAYSYGQDGFLIRCGCRLFTPQQAEDHWLSPDYHNRSLGKAKMMVVENMVALFEAGLLLVQKKEDERWIKKS